MADLAVPENSHHRFAIIDKIARWRPSFSAWISACELVVAGNLLLWPSSHLPFVYLKTPPEPPLPGLVKVDPFVFSFMWPGKGGFHEIKVFSRWFVVFLALILETKSVVLSELKIYSSIVLPRMLFGLVVVVCLFVGAKR